MSRSIPSSLFLVMAALILACGPYDRPSARSVATARACNRYQTCGEIGSGKTFATLDDCQVQTNDTFNNLWSSAACDSIERKDLDVCLQAIDITQCNNTLDFLNTVFNKCGASQVCGP